MDRRPAEVDSPMEWRRAYRGLDALSTPWDPPNLDSRWHPQSLGQDRTPSTTA